MVAAACVPWFGWYHYTSKGVRLSMPVAGGSPAHLLRMVFVAAWQKPGETRPLLNV